MADNPLRDPNDDVTADYMARRERIERQGIIERARRRSEATQTAGGDFRGTPASAGRSMQPEQPEAEGGGAGAVAADVAKGATEAPRAMFNGIRDAGQEFLDNSAAILDYLTGDAAQVLEDWIPLGGIDLSGDAPGYMTPAELREQGGVRGVFRSPQLPDPLEDPDSTTGRAVQGITQFVAGFIPALRAVKAAGIGSEATRTGRLAQNATAGLLADVGFIDENEARLSNLVEKFPALSNPVTEFLAADPNDDMATAKLKQAMEGLAIGGLADLTVEGVRYLSKARRARKAAGEPVDIESVEPQIRQPIDTETLGNPNAPLVRVDDSLRQQADDFLRMGPAAEIPEKIGNINLSRVGGPEDVREIIRRTARVFEDKITHGAQSNEQTMALANEITRDPEQLAEVLTREGAAFNAQEVTALRFLLHGSGRRLKELANKVSSVGASDVDKFELQRQMAFHQALIEQTSASAREAGRALQAFQITSRSAREQEIAIREMLNNPGMSRRIEDVAQRLSAIDTPEGMNTFVRQAEAAKGPQQFLEAWINGLLSNPTTHAVNTTSNQIVALWQVPERWLASGIRKVTGGEGVAVGEARHQLFGMVRGMRDGIRLAGKALRTGEASDPLLKVENLRRPALTAENFRRTWLGKGINTLTRGSLEDGGIAARGVDLLGEYVIRLPGRFLAAEDEFFKSVGYRMELHARAFRQASQEGLQGKAAARRIEQIINNPPEDLRIAAVDAARYQTFTRELGEAGQSVQRAVNQFPAARVVMPFIRTPVNIMKYVGERTPLAPLSRNIRADIAAGGARRDIALARMGLGSMMMATFADLSVSGHITGGGPTDPQLRQALRRTGWQPYSIKVGDKYYAYSRLDPIGATLGISADMAEILGEADEGDAEEMAAASIMAVSQNIISKTYMSGIADLMEIFSSVSPELGATRGERYLQRLAGSLVPAGVAQLARQADPTLRQVESMVEQIRSRIPGFSEDLPPRLNLWGEPIQLGGGLGPDIVSPLYVSERKPDAVNDEIVRLGTEVSMPQRSIDGVELTPEEYNEYTRLAGNEIKDPSTGLGAKESLDALISGRHPLSATYQAASDGPDGGKSVIIKEVISGFRDAARNRMRQSPRLRSAIAQKKREERQALMGGQ